VDLYEFEASLAYKSSSRTAKATQRDPVLEKKKKKGSKKEEKLFPLKAHTIFIP
jgi:hypothetical protein